MTDIQARIDRVMELDKLRSPGKWRYIEEGKPDYHYISKDGRRALDDSVLHDDGIYHIDDNDMRYIAAAPEMVSIIKELQQKNADLYAAMEIIKQPIQDAYQNAVHLSLENNARVEFEFNGTAYKVSPHRLGKKVAELQAQLSAKDALIAELQKRISNVQDVTNIQCSKGNWDYDSYMRGMANGLICAMAILNNNIEPIYLEPPKGI